MLFTSIFQEHKGFGKQIVLLAKNELIKTYKGAVIGPLWSVVKPAFTIFVYWFAFSVGIKALKAVKVHLNGLEHAALSSDFFAFMFIGIVPWFFIQDQIVQGAKTLRNNRQFINNSKSYGAMMAALQTIERLNIVTLVIIGLANLAFVVLIASTIAGPLVRLAATADSVSKGDFDVPLPTVKSNDEVGVVTGAFNKMVISIKDYIAKLTESMEATRKLRENELIMENHVKDAELKYLQSQINPHFLFNTLNAGAQLAMMEGADRTSTYIQRVADFFRYNIKKNKDVVTLKEEIELVDIYIYIINVRFAGEIQFTKEIDEGLLDTKIPSMIIQPIVENSINYGIRNIEWAKKIKLSVYALGDYVCVSVKDNGIGIEKETIEKILDGSYVSNPNKADSNGVGLNNCIERLNIFYERDDVLDIISEGKDKGTETILYLPK